MKKERMTPWARDQAFTFFGLETTLTKLLKINGRPWRTIFELFCFWKQCHAVGPIRIAGVIVIVRDTSNRRSTNCHSRQTARRQIITTNPAAVSTKKPAENT